MTVSTTNATAAPAAIIRGPMTWYGYMLIGSYIYILNVQGNVIPFLQAEFALSYQVVSLHTSAIAIGIILTGLFGERVTLAIGRRRALWLGAGGLGLGAILLCLAPASWASIGSCFLLGLCASFLPSVVPAIFADMYGERRGEIFAEQAILAYAFAIVGPLSAAAFVASGIGWRISVIIGGLFALGLIVTFRNVHPPEATVVEKRADAAPLPPAFWAYSALLCFSCALEFSILLWAPTFLERVAGFTPAMAAAIATAFYVGVLSGRIALRALLRRIEPHRIMFGAFAIGIVSFAIYWGIAAPAASVIGIFGLGLCIAPLYPLTMTFGLGAAKGANDAAAARLTLAFGISLLVAPLVLGSLADQVGLRLAHLTLPALIAASLASFIAALLLERRRVSPAT